MQKPKRTVNLELLETYREMPCIVCLKGPCVAHHIKTKGSGGPDEEFNLIPLCVKHHSEIHKIGAGEFFFTRHTGSMPYLNKLGWCFVNTGRAYRIWTLWNDKLSYKETK